MNSPSSHAAVPRSSGVTLIELMVTLSILAILMALAVPSYQGLIASSRLSSASADFSTTLAQARQSAIKSGHRITVCKSADGAACAESGNWEQGWILFNDFNRSGTTASVVTVDGVADTVISTFPSLPSDLVMKGNTPVASYISFSADGLSKTMSGGALLGTVRLCSTSGYLADDKRARDFVLNRAGRLVVKTPPGIDASCPSP